MPRRARFMVLGSAAGAALVLVVSMSMSCARSGAPPRTEVRIFAAASLTDALSEALERFTSENPSIRAVPQFGSSSDLARQILAGAPSDLFFSADERQMDRLARAGALEEGAVRPLLSNELVIIEAENSPRRVLAPEDVATAERIALADPEAVPAGVYARAYLESKGLWRSLEGKIVPTLDVRAALAAVASGNIEVGFVYGSDAAIEPRVRVAYRVPRDEGPRIVYPVAILAGRGSEASRALFDFLESKDASDVFARFGFVPIEGGP